MTENNEIESSNEDLKIKYFPREEGNEMNGPWPVLEEEIEEDSNFTRHLVNLSNAGYLEIGFTHTEKPRRNLFEKFSRQYPESIVFLEEEDKFLLNVNFMRDTKNGSQYFSQLDEVANLTILEREGRDSVVRLSVDASEKIVIQGYHNDQVSFGGGRYIRISPGMFRHNLEPNKKRLKHLASERKPFYNEITTTSVFENLNLKTILNMNRGASEYDLYISNRKGQFREIIPLKKSKYAHNLFLYGRDLENTNLANIDGNYAKNLLKLWKITKLYPKDYLLGLSEGVLFVEFVF